MNYGSYYVIAAPAEGMGLWSDLASNNSPDNGSNGKISWNSRHVQPASGWEFTRAGRYDDASNYPSEPANQTSVQDSVYPVANLGYNVAAVPEPASLSLVDMGSVVVFGFVRRRKARKAKDLMRNQFGSVRLLDEPGLLCRAFFEYS